MNQSVAAPVKERVPNDPLPNQQFVEPTHEPLQSHVSPQPFDNAPSNQSIAAPASNQYNHPATENSSVLPSLYPDNTTSSSFPAQPEKGSLSSASIEPQPPKPTAAEPFAKEAKPIPSLEEKRAMDKLSTNPSLEEKRAMDKLSTNNEKPIPSLEEKRAMDKLNSGDNNLNSIESIPAN
jgi:hypothetical protein